MSQYRVKKNETTYAYGYDHPLSEYFLIKFAKNKDEEDESLVGTMSDTYGSGLNLLNKMQELGLPIKKEHENAMFMDLSF